MVALKSLLKKRDFTKKEEKLFKELSRKKIRLNSEEHSELRNLYKSEFISIDQGPPILLH